MIQNNAELLPELQEMLDAGYVSIQKHPTEDLFIYNYTQRTQFDRVWNQTTMSCRGLILDGQGNVVARPFKKFFNLGEPGSQLPEPGLKYKITDKVDGSLGILYWIGERPFIATRGSFTSDQAIKGTHILHQFDHLWGWFDRDLTYLFEILFPENRIVVDYGDKQGLVFLAAIDKKTGADVSVSLPIEYYLGKRAMPMVGKGWRIEAGPYTLEAALTYEGYHDIHKLHELARDNAEGFVIQWENGHRLKVKFEEYKRLHRLMTGCNSRMIWELLAISQVRHEIPDAKTIAQRLKMDMTFVENVLNKTDPFADFAERVPDEFYQWVELERRGLVLKSIEIRENVKAAYLKSGVSKMSRKEAAKIITEQYPDISTILFNMLDGRYWDYLVWNMIRPEHVKPFKVQSEDIA